MKKIFIVFLLLPLLSIAQVNEPSPAAKALFDQAYNNPTSLQLIVSAFVQDAKDFGINVDYILDPQIVRAHGLTINTDEPFFSILFTDTMPVDSVDTSALAYASCDNTRVEIEVDRHDWNNESFIGRLWIVYHELGHDVLNLRHVNIGEDAIMSNSGTYRYFWTPQSFLDARARMFNDYKAGSGPSARLSKASTCLIIPLIQHPNGTYKDAHDEARELQGLPSLIN